MSKIQSNTHNALGWVIMISYLKHQI